MSVSLMLALHLGATVPDPPPTPTKPVTTEYQSVKVVDDYRWLENDQDPSVRAWSDAQNTYARSVLDQVPHRAEIQKRVEALIRSNSESYGQIIERRGKLFALKSDPKKQQPFIVSLPDLDHPEQARVLLDPNALDTSGHTAIDFWVPSLDGTKLAVSLSQGGSEAGDVHTYDVATGKEIDAAVTHVNNGTAGGSVAWNADGTGFWYTRYPRGAEHAAADLGFFQQVYFHHLGVPTEKDTYELGKELPRIAEILLDTSDDGQYVIAEVENGDGGEVEYFLKKVGGAWTPVSGFGDGIKHAALGRDGALYLLSRKGAPKGKVLRLPLSTPQLTHAEEVVPEGEGSIETLVPTAQKLYVVDLLGGPSRVRSFPLHGGAPEVVKTPEVSTVSEVDRLPGGEVAFEVGTYVAPPAFYRLNENTGAVTQTKLVMTSLADYSDCEVVRDVATSKDGTKVPLNIIRKKGVKLDGHNPTLLYGYGGYSISEQPGFSASRRVWLDAGGVYVDVNLRGGGEFGEAWHLAGNLTHKQNVFDDFYAAAQYLEQHHYCDPQHLAILGASNGGLLMGAELTQHPEAWKAVVSKVGIYDMLRFEETPNGGFNITELGTVKDPDQFKALYAYSPYHRVKKGQTYPAVLFMTGANDPRVDPWHSRKMVALLQRDNAASTPILLRTSSSSGHGVGSSLDEVIAEYVDQWGFLLAQLGVDYRAPAAAAK